MEWAWSTEARQESLGRDVALKFLHRADFASENQLIRFKREAAAISRLRHPNFVQIYDYGTHQGCPYLVLEYIDGGTLGDKISGLAQPLEFATACVETLATAMQHAHQHGVVHRDLKPNNVLISTDGVLKITDLGLSRQLPMGPDQSVERHTESGTVIGTPAYMAPEQFSGELETVTVSADVYALGVILYQLLTGTLPFQAANFFDLLTKVRSQEPIPPRDLRPDVSRDLETICLKCLHKEPAKRYATAADLALDLHNFRGGQPITARRTGATERSWRWARRNPLAASLVATVFLLLAGGLWITTSLYMRARTQATRADQNYQLALQAVETYLSNISESPDLTSRGMEPLRKQLLTTAQNFYQQLLGQQSPGFEVTEKMAESHFRLATIQSQLGDRDAAIEHYAAAQDAYHRLTVQQPGVPEYAYWLSLCHSNLGNNLQMLGDYPTAEMHERQACEICKGLCRKFPHEMKYRLYFLNSLSQLVLLYGQTNQPSLEQASWEEAQTVYDELSNAPRADLSDDELYQVHKSMGALFQRHGMIAEAQASFRAMQQMCQELVDRHPELTHYQYQLASSNSYLALLNQQAGKTDDARRAYDEADELLATLTQRYPLVSNYRYQRAVNLMNRGGLELAQASWDQAETCWQRSRDLVQSLQRDFPEVDEYTLTLAQLAMNLGNVAYSRDDFDVAGQEYQQSLELGFIVLDAHPDNTEYQDAVGGAYHGLGTAQFALEQYEAALYSLKQSQAIRQRMATAYPDVPIYQSYLASTLHNLAEVYGVTHRLELAEASYRAACETSRKLYTAYPDTLSYADVYADTLNNLGNLLFDAGRVDEALVEYERARLIREGLVEQDPQCLPYFTKLGHVTYNLSRGRLLEGDAEGASRCFEQAANYFRVASAEAGSHDLRESIRDSLLGLARSRYRLGNDAAALESLKEAELLPVELDTAELQALRARCQARQGQLIPALEVADALRERTDLPPSTRIDLAAVYALAADNRPASPDPTSGDAERYAALCT